MCGIFGVLHTDTRPLDLGAIRIALSTMRHRGPDDEGYLLASTITGQAVPCAGTDTVPTVTLPPLDNACRDMFNLAFGFRRLAILDLSAGGHQPMESADGDLWIVFNGEVYNYVGLREELRRLGHNFRTNSDTEVILAAYKEWGDSCCEHLRGMWAFAVWDRRTQELFCARDRFGIKPFYYSWSKDSFAFASEIKALVGPHGVPFRADDHAIFRYVVLGALPSPRTGETFFRGIVSLAPAHRMRVDCRSGQIRISRFWRPPVSGDTEGWREGARGGLVKESAAASVARYRHLFEESIREHLQSDVPIGTCLSGGVDSSSIVCLIAHLMRLRGVDVRQLGEVQQTFSAVYDTEARYNERRYVDKVVSTTGAENTLVYPGYEQLKTDLDRLVWHQEEPFQSTSVFAQWCVMQAVRDRRVLVLLDGQGADEVLGGYGPFEIYLGDVLWREGVGRAIREARSLRWGDAISPFYVLGRAAGRRLFPPLAQVIRNERLRRALALASLQREFVTRQQGFAGCAATHGDERMGLDHHLRSLVEESSLPHLLRYEDRNSMAFSVEARVPFLDHRLVEFSLTTGSAFSIHRGWTKWLLRQSMADVLPAEFAWREGKIGYETPEAAWLSRLLLEEPEWFAEQSACGEYLDLSGVKAACGRAAGGKKDARLIWRWINLQRWLDVWQQKRPSPLSRV